jgi:hypothetical protein
VTIAIFLGRSFAETEEAVPFELVLGAPGRRLLRPTSSGIVRFVELIIKFSFPGLPPQPECSGLTRNSLYAVVAPPAAILLNDWLD